MSKVAYSVGLLMLNSVSLHKVLIVEETKTFVVIKDRFGDIVKKKKNCSSQVIFDDLEEAKEFAKSELMKIKTRLSNTIALVDRNLKTIEDLTPYCEHLNKEYN